MKLLDWALGQQEARRPAPGDLAWEWRGGAHLQHGGSGGGGRQQRLSEMHNTRLPKTDSKTGLSWQRKPVSAPRPGQEG